jgi:meso-butanediol dehydrogenase/(S,S)-butanediol dehydrogenase/diacetyl reductase
MSRMRFTEKVALISGGGTGIGAAVAAKIIAEGGTAIIMGRRAEPLAVVADSLGATVVVGDAASSSDVGRAVQTAVERFGGLDIVIANAGGHGFGTVTETDDRMWSLSIRSNLDTAFISAREALPELKRRRGNIVVMSSLAGLSAAPGAAGYVTMKHALIGLTKSLARDYGRFGVRANAVCPGWVRTDMADAEMKVLVEMAKLSSIDEAYDLVTRNVPLRRPVEPDEVADVVCFLASNEASMITGATLPVDGGASIVDVPTIAFDN